MTEVDIKLLRKLIPKVASLVGTRNFNLKILLFIGIFSIIHAKKLKIGYIRNMVNNIVN